MFWGEVLLWFIYDYCRNRLVVIVFSVKEFVLLEFLFKMNFYVQINLLFFCFKKLICKMDFYVGSLNFVFNEIFEYVIGFDQLSSKYLEVIIKNERFV